MAAKPLEAAPGSQHHWGPSPKTSHWECEGCTGDVMAVTGSPGASHRASLEETHPAPDLGPTHHLIASQSTVVRRGWRMDEKPALPSQKQEGRQWGKMLPHISLLAPRHTIGRAPGGPQRRRPSLAIWPCLLGVLTVYSRYYKSSPRQVSTVHSPAQTCNRQTLQTQLLAVEQHTANRSNECKGRGEKKISKKKDEHQHVLCNKLSASTKP